MLDKFSFPTHPRGNLLCCQCETDSLLVQERPRWRLEMPSKKRKAKSKKRKKQRAADSDIDGSPVLASKSTRAELEGMCWFLCLQLLEIYHLNLPCLQIRVSCANFGLCLALIMLGTSVLDLRLAMSYPQPFLQSRNPNRRYATKRMFV